MIFGKEIDTVNKIPIGPSYDWYIIGPTDQLSCINKKNDSIKLIFYVKRATPFLCSWCLSIVFFLLQTHLLCIWPSTFEYINYVIVRFSHFLKSTMLKSEFRGLAILMLFSLFINKYCSLTFPFLKNEYLSHLSMNQVINFSSCQTVMHKIEKWTESLSLRVVAYFFYLSSCTMTTRLSKKYKIFTLPFSKMQKKKVICGISP